MSKKNRLLKQAMIAADAAGIDDSLSAPTLTAAETAPVSESITHFVPLSEQAGGKHLVPTLKFGGPAKLKSAPKRPTKPAPTIDAPYTVEDGNLAYWQVGNTLFLAMDISAETIAASEQLMNQKTGKPYPSKIISRVRQGFGGVALDGLPFKLNLSLTAPVGA